MFFNCLNSFLILSLLLLTSVWSFDEIDFHNVGQGHCVVATSGKGILVIDAGSSSTIGIDGIPENKYEVLANKISSSIKSRIELVEKERGFRLNFIITHADKDHLNLSKPIIEDLLAQGVIEKKAVKFILGGKTAEYSTRDASTLIDFLNEERISYADGDSFTQDARDPLLWISPAILESRLSLKDVSFLSVKSDIAAKAPKRKAGGVIAAKAIKESEKRNASSIVVKIMSNYGSIMITGDKTKPEIAHIIANHTQEGKLDNLKSDILLATHHGSAEDFSPEWLKTVKPAYLVVSCGTSPFFHPRYDAVCSPDVLSSIRYIENIPWHPIRFFGEEGKIEFKDKIFPVCSDKPDNFRSKPYSYAMTNLGIYITADQGTIKFSFEEKGKGKDKRKTIIVKPSKQGGEADLNAAFSSFLRSPTPWSKIILYPSTFTKENINWIRDNCSELINLDLGSCNVTDSAADDLCALITRILTLSSVNLLPNSLNKDNKLKIIEVWKHRGLTL